MNITDLKSFLIVAEYRSFEFAAKRMHVATSTISKRIKKIESELNKSLFITRGNMLILSSEGQYCLP
ncbi:helix-turn-helix domain-containing protein, partial [Legionella sainthelensi]|uniref:helix-turn-helix domain-containing protein n=1 Tax=Legionella sainthelensi TaxID=28087 RepID=UPI0013595D7D